MVDHGPTGFTTGTYKAAQRDLAEVACASGSTTTHYPIVLKQTERSLSGFGDAFGSVDDFHVPSYRHARNVTDNLRLCLR